MAQLIDLGKLRFEFRGTYNSGILYESNDVVRYGGNLYVYTNVTATTGNEPTDTSYWALMVEGFNFRGEWNDSTLYNLGDVVSYGGKVFISNEDNTNESPGSPPASGSSEIWSQLVDGVQYEGEYNTGFEYQTGDIVKYGGILYIAVADSLNAIPTDTDFWEILVNGISYEGAYNSTTEYKLNDVVTYGGGSYICTAPTTGNDPTDTEYWDIFVEGIQYEGEYNSLTNYQVGDVVNYGGIVYICIDDTVGNDPSNTNYWSILIEGISYKGIYSAEIEYNKNDIVSYDGSSWIAIQNTLGNNPEDPSAFWDVLAPGTFPSFVGNEGYFLSNNGSAVVWTADLAADSLDIGEAFYVGNGAKEFALDLTTDGEPLTNPVATFRFDNDSEDSSFAQLAFQNADPTSSTDIIAYMDNGSDSAGWMGMGITGSNFDDTTYGITAPGDGYLFLETAGDPGDYTGNMVFATGANGSENKLVFAAGGFDSGLTQMEITPGENVHIEIPTPSTSPSTGALTVVGGVGIQGDMNIAGNVDIVGTISFGGSGTTVTTQNLAVSDPVIFAGSNNLSDNVDLGLVGEYAEDIVDQVTSVTNKSLTNNVATLTTSATHGYSIGDVVVVSGVDTTFNGTYVITGVPTTTTFTYAKTAGNVSSTAVSPTGVATVTHERRWAGVVRDVSDSGTIKFFQGLTDKPTTTVDFANANLTFAPVRLGNLTANNINVGNITSTSGTVSLGGTVSITSSANFTGANVTLGSGTWSGAPTFSGNITFSGTPIFSGNPSFTGTPTFTGGIRVQEMVEDIVDVAHASNIITADYNNGNIFILTNTLSANATVNLTNVPTTDGRVFTVNLLVPQGSTGYIPSVVNINGAGATLRWAAGTTPTPTSSSGKIDIFTFTIIRRSAGWTLLGSANLNF